MFSLAVLYQQHEEKSFLSWMRETNQLYTGDEYQTRFGIWMSNKRRVDEHNRQEGFKVSTNKFAAMTPSEYRSTLGFKSSVRRSNDKMLAAPKKNEATLDWRDKGVVNDVKDQGQCGSCWAFSATQALESHWAIRFTELLRVSEQNLVDCVTDCYGCNGGIMSAAYDYIMKKQNREIALEDDYPYTARSGTCQYDSSKGVMMLMRYYESTNGDEKVLEQWTNLGPVCIAIDASQWSFQLYSGGIYDEPSCSSEDLDHAVGCVGYGDENGVEYWIVRNSWGSSWGEGGYIRMSKNKNNQCGVASNVDIPTYNH